MSAGAKAKAVDHVGVVVSDLLRSVRWYTEILGASFVAEEEGEDGEVRRCFLALGEVAVELIEHRATGAPYRLSMNDAGALHICIQVEDLQAAYERLLDAEVCPTTPPETLLAGTSLRALYFRDPDDVLIQLLQIPPDMEAMLGYRPGGIHHIGFTVTDLERAAAWCERTLGIVPSAWPTNSGEVVSRMLEVPETSQRAAYIPVGGSGIEILAWEHPRGKRYSMSSHDVGAMHICFEVDDADRAHDELMAGGVDAAAVTSLVVGRARGCRSFHVLDPEGLQFELIQRGED
jgi:catechol 2,3-dioxygenase-like lactoylglutathione lyase family enzyme